MRWALALATDIQGVSMATFNGMLRVSPLPIPPTSVLQKTYMFPMEGWLAELTLPDGFRPFDPGYAEDLACPDLQAPSVPTGFTEQATTQTGVVLAWQPSADNVGVVGYRVYRNALPVQNTTSPSATLTEHDCSWFVRQETCDDGGRQ